MDRLQTNGNAVAALPGTTAIPKQTADTRDGRSLLRLFERRLKVMIAVFAGFVLLVVVASLLSPKSYTTVVKLIAGTTGTSNGNASPDSALPILNALLLANGNQSAETYAELFQETPVAQQVIQNLGLKTSPGKLLKNVSIQPVTNTPILALAVTWSDPVTSAKIANEFGTVVISRQRDLIAAQAISAIGFLSKELPTAQKRLTDAQTALAAYETSHNIADISTQTQGLISALSAIDARVGQEQVDQRQAAAQLATVQSQLNVTPANINGQTSIDPNPVRAQLDGQLAQVDVQLDTARRQYTEKYPAVTALENQRAELQRQIAVTPATVVAASNTVPNPVYQQLEQLAAQLRAQIASAHSQISTLRSQRVAMHPSLAKLPKEAAQLADLERAQKSAETVYSALQSKYDNASVAKSTALSDVTVTQPATAAGALVRPNLLLNTLVAILVGAILAITTAYVMDFFDRKARDQEDVEQELALAPLASVPLIQLKDGALVQPWVKALTIESFWQLLMSVRYSLDHPVRSLSITSPTQGDGKSTVALNTAIAMAEFDPYILLVDSDMRRPSIHRMLGLKNDVGLSDFLAGTKDLSDVIRQTRYPGLDVITSGTNAPNPLKLLESGRFDALMERALERYRCVIFDSAATTATFDPAVVSLRTDGTIFVVSSGVTDLRKAKEALKRFEQVGVRNILGFVLNRVAPTHIDYSGYYLGQGNASAVGQSMITSG